MSAQYDIFGNDGIQTCASCCFPSFLPIIYPITFIPQLILNFLLQLASPELLPKTLPKLHHLPQPQPITNSCWIKERLTWKASSSIERPPTSWLVGLASSSLTLTDVTQSCMFWTASSFSAKRRMTCRSSRLSDICLSRAS